MTDPNGWPDPQRPGVPMNPERDGYHWLGAVDRGEPTGHTAVMLWFAGTGFYAIEAVPVSHRNITEHWRYLGPCLTPAEVAARVAEARRDALREAAEEVDCGCPERAAVLSRLRDVGQRFARGACRHGAECCALQAAAILARAEAKP
jgi:hypothetical protein